MKNTNKPFSFQKTLAFNLSASLLTVSAFALTACNADNSETQQTAEVAEPTDNTQNPQEVGNQTAKQTNNQDENSVENQEQNAAPTTESSVDTTTDTIKTKGMVEQTMVSYTCQHDKTISVYYQFDTKGRPIVAEFTINGTVHRLPINDTYTNELDTIFGDESDYVLATDVLNANNAMQKSILITNPAQEIEFKNCDAVAQ